MALRLIPLLALAVLLTACSARQQPAAPPTAAVAPSPAPSPATTPPIDIPGLIERGCYACLQRAFAAARAQDDRPLAFEASLLLALRAKELGLPHQEWVDEAAAAAKGDPGLTGLVEIVQAMPLHPLSGQRDAPFNGLVPRVRGQTVNAWLDNLPEAPGSPVLRGYLALALVCSAGGGSQKPDLVVAPALRRIRLIQYRLGLCGDAYGAELRAVRSQDVEFVDADVGLARYAMDARPYPDADEAIRLLRFATAAFPRSPAIAASLGEALQAIEDWPGAIAAYDAALALVDGHPDALLGRTISLSSLNDYDAAIESATRMLAGRWYLGEAYYWRAFNYFNLEQYVLARDDADRMKSVLVNSRAHLLSGMIDWRLKRLESAEIEFERSLAMEAGQCEAATFLGGVRNERQKSPEALEAFTHARRCWELAITVNREMIRNLEASHAPEAYKTRETARHTRFIARAERRRDEAAFGIDLLQKYLTSLEGRQKSPRQ